MAIYFHVGLPIKVIEERNVLRAFCLFFNTSVAEMGDYFGLDLLLNKRHGKISVVLDQDISKYKIGVSINSLIWVWLTYAACVYVFVLI